MAVLQTISSLQRAQASPVQTAGKTAQRSFRDAVTAAVQTVSATPTGLNQLYDRLPEEAQAVVTRIRDGENIEQQDWRQLAEALCDLGVLTREEMEAVSVEHHFLPVGYTNAAGETVLYPHPMLEERLSALAGGGEDDPEALYQAASAFDWEGDLLRWLDRWTSHLRQWRTDLSYRRTESGAPYDTRTITEQIAACEKASSLVKQLIRG